LKSCRKHLVFARSNATQLARLEVHGAELPAFSGRYRPKTRKLPRTSSRATLWITRGPKDEMFSYTDIKQAPWYVVNADNKECAR